MKGEFRLFPEQASLGAERVDALYFFLLAVASFFTLLIFLLIVYFALKYRKGRIVDRANPVHELWSIEIGWSIVPLILTMIMFGWGASLYVAGSQAPANALVIDVIGKQWMWRIYHGEGKREINTLHVPVGRPVKLRMISDDVIHSFYLPAFRVKQDVLPGRHTQLWFEATKPGEYHLFCAEYCGTDHSRMRGSVVVMEPRDFAAWLADSEDEPPPALGEKLFGQFHCDHCHRDDPQARGPALAGVFGSNVPLADGGAATADVEYLRESILDPAVKIVAGHRNEMPTFRGQLGEEEVLHLVAYIQSLRAADAQRGGPP